jgi:hypothetical protein
MATPERFQEIVHIAVPAQTHSQAHSETGPKMFFPALTTAQAPHAAVAPNAAAALNGAGAPNASGTSNNLRTINRRRILATVDPLGSSAQNLQDALKPIRMAAGARLFGGLQRIHLYATFFQQALQQPKLPATLIGAIHQPDGTTAAARVQVQFQPSTVGAKGAAVTVLTNDLGAFTLDMPSGATIPDAGISLTIHAANTNAPVTVQPNQIAANGMIGVITSPVNLSPLPVSIVQALIALAPPPPLPGASAPATPQQQHNVTIGEAGSACLQTFEAGATVDRFPWSVFFRMVEPQMSIATQAEEIQIGPLSFSWMPIYATDTNAANGTASKFVDRVPVDQPLSVDGFRDQIAGIDALGNFTEDETVPMAASLGLGYVLQMSQQWTLQGLGLGNLVYSLPLAPGEQQQVAVFERRDTTAVQESEFFSEAEVSQQTALSDTSTNACFQSAFNELAMGTSNFYSDTQTHSSAWSAGGGFNLGLIGGGGGGSGSSSDITSTGNAQQMLAGQRDALSQASQATHSSAENQAAARVTSNRTGMRMATASESMDVTTKIITNHNHTRALTMQYWEVQRLYDVTTSIDGLTLACLVPMQIVRFMPPRQPAALNDAAIVNSPNSVRLRYANILSHLDVLRRVVPRRFHHGLNLLAEFAADPTTVVDASTSSAETVIKFRLQGSFVSCETISVVAVTKRNTRIGPVQLGPETAGQPAPIPQNTFLTQDQLVAWLTGQRTGTMSVLQGSLALPPSLNRSDVVGFEISRQYNTVRYTLFSPIAQAFANSAPQLQNAGALLPFLTPATVTLAATDLEPLLGGPMLGGFYAAVEDFNASGMDQPTPQETYANDNLSGTVLPPQPFPVPALQIAPVLRYKDILEIEKAAQHIVRNTTRYSRAVWLSMTPEETAILLDQYTIGVPSGGLPDASQMIPLLNCVQNKILGTFGNSLILPFSIPQDLADEMGINPAQLTQSLLAYQQDAFVSPESTVALPTRGVLGEAVLGHCTSAEKIDLTRFWNWQDAPADTAPGIGAVQLPTTTPPLTTGVTAPNSLTNLPPLINNLITAPQPNTGLLQAMGQQATSQPDFSPTLTGQQQLSGLMQNTQTLANQARSDALKTSQDMSSQALTAMTSVITAALGASGSGGGKGAGAGTGKGGAQNAGSGKSGTTPASASGSNAAGAATSSGTGSGNTPSSNAGTAAPALANLLGLIGF